MTSLSKCTIGGFQSRTGNARNAGPFSLELASGILFVTIIYFPVLIWLFQQWGANRLYSHGYLVVPISAFLAWRRRHEFGKLSKRPTNIGLFVLVCAVLLQLAAAFFDAKSFGAYSLIGVVAGVVLYLWGWGTFWLVAFPIGFLVFMIPMYSMVINPINFALKLYVSVAAAWVIDLIGIPIWREGVMLHMSDADLLVADPCSGIRSLVALLALGAVFAHLSEGRMSKRIILFALTVPLALISNLVRVILLCLGAEFMGVDVTVEGPFHTGTGLVVFIVAFVGLVLCERVLRWVLREDASG